MSDILKQIAELERELGPLPPYYSRQDFLEMVPIWMQYPDDDGEGLGDPDFVTDNADFLWLKQLVKLKELKDSQPDLWRKMLSWD